MDSQCAKGRRPLRADDFDKDIEAKKSLLPRPVNYISRRSFQPSPSISQPNKMNSRPRQRGNSCQQDGILVTSVNATTVKKTRKTEKDFN